MLAAVTPKLETGLPTVSRTVRAGNVAEGAYAAALSAIAECHPDLSIGSYPSMVDGRFDNEIVVRGKDESKVAEAVAAIGAFLARMQKN
jgi:hypothetical protein